MKSIFHLLLITYITSTNLLIAQKLNKYAPNEIIVQFKKSNKTSTREELKTNYLNQPSFQSLNENYDLASKTPTGNRKNDNSYILHFSNKQDIIKLIKAYQKTGLFNFVEPNYIGYSGGIQRIQETDPNDNYFSRQWGLFNDGSFTEANNLAKQGADIEMKLAWDIEKGDSNIIVAVLDSGIKFDHPEFNGRIWTNSNESINNHDDDNNGYSDDLNGWDFAKNDNNPSDELGHGTNVAGIIGANGNNNLGYAGVDWNCKIMNLRILDENNQGFYSWWADAIYYAVDNGASVINMSVGGSSYSQLLHNAIEYAYNNGVVVVACMMNNDHITTYYPAGFETTIAVGSTDPNDNRSSPFFWSSTSGSNYGQHIDVVAPGNYIYGLNYISNQNYNSYWGGTSQATPLVAGLSSLLLSQDINRSPDEIRDIIKSTAIDQIGDPLEDSFGPDIYYGHGRINAYQALLHGISSSSSIKNQSHINIYPNPVNDILFISNNSDYNTIKIFNILGQLQMKKILIPKSSLAEINTTHLAAGIYIIQFMKQNSKKTIFKKIVVQ